MLSTNTTNMSTEKRLTRRETSLTWRSEQEGDEDTRKLPVSGGGGRDTSVAAA